MIGASAIRSKCGRRILRGNAATFCRTSLHVCLPQRLITSSYFICSYKAPIGLLWSSRRSTSFLGTDTDSSLLVFAASTRTRRFETLSSLRGSTRLLRLPVSPSRSRWLVVQWFFRIRRNGCTSGWTFCRGWEQIRVQSRISRLEYRHCRCLLKRTQLLGLFLDLLLLVLVLRCLLILGVACNLRRGEFRSDHIFLDIAIIRRWWHINRCRKEGVR